MFATLRELSPAPDSLRVAVRMSLAVLIGLSILVAAERTDWAAFAMFGALSGLYGGMSPTRDRWRAQASLGGIFVLVSVTGTLVGISANRQWLVLPLCAVWAGASAALSDRYRWRPPGALFTVFAVSTIAAIPAEPADLLPALLVTAAAAAFAIGLGLLETALWPGGESSGEHAPAGPEAFTRRNLVNVLRCAIAVVAAGVTANALGIAHAGWAMVAAVVPLVAPELHHQLARSLHRIVGTLAGLVPAAILLALDLSPVGIVVALTVLQFGIDFTVARHYALALVFVTPVPLLITQLSAPQEAMPLLRDRLLETLIGVAIGTLVALLIRPPREVSPATV